MTRSARDHLLETALRLFHRDGFHATGIDRVLAESGVAKATLYKYFPSKDELILAVLRLRDDRFRRFLQDGVAARAVLPRDQLLALFDLLAEWFQEEGFHGCLFINVAAEFGSKGSAFRLAAAEHKALLLDWLTGLTAAAGAANPQGLAQKIALLKEGAIATALVSGGPASAHLASAMVKGLLESMITPSKVSLATPLSQD